GRVSEVLVNEGSEVKAGEPLVRFDISELFAERQKLEARIEQAEANLRKLQAGYRPEEIAQAEAAASREHASLEALRNGARPQELAQAKAELDAEKANLKNEKENFERFDGLYTDGFESRQNRDN